MVAGAANGQTQRTTKPSAAGHMMFMIQHKANVCVYVCMHITACGTAAHCVSIHTGLPLLGLLLPLQTHLLGGVGCTPARRTAHSTQQRCVLLPSAHDDSTHLLNTPGTPLPNHPPPLQMMSPLLRLASVLHALSARILSMSTRRPEKAAGCRRGVWVVVAHEGQNTRHRSVKTAACAKACRQSITLVQAGEAAAVAAAVACPSTTKRKVLAPNSTNSNGPPAAVTDAVCSQHRQLCGRVKHLTDPCTLQHTYTQTPTTPTCKRLLAHQPLCCSVELLNEFAWQQAGRLNLHPLPYAKLHEAQLETQGLLLGPARRWGEVPAVCVRGVEEEWRVGSRSSSGRVNNGAAVLCWAAAVMLSG